MPCSQINLTPVSLSAPTPVASTGYTAISGQRLYVCDNPEPLTSATFSTPIITLWDDIVPNSTSVNYRVFIWHHNDTSSTIKYGLTVGNAGGNPVTVSSIKYDTTVTANGGDILTNAGLCLAKALLGQTLTSESTTVTIPSGSVQTVKEFTLAAGQVRGLVMEFTLSSASAMSAKIRTVAGNSTAAILNTHQGAVIGSVSTHPRGTWNYADVQGANATLTLGSGGTSNSISILGDNPSILPGTLANSASFGGIYKCNLTISNTSGSSQTANLYLNPRGGLFVGAVKVGSNPVYGIAKTTTAQSVKIGAFSLANGQSVTVPIQVTTGGGSSTPIAFFVRNA
ncbi:hypothetical protein [Paenibacillus zanthoxyli]|uniref:hypothetical protein n=1 Tax=Paenibacillus zanthoxyli TaxID=369399 RepID=UPI0004B14729|nr:hypothetical protein [Paenibacillus zanthoxyli]